MIKQIINAAVKAGQKEAHKQIDKAVAQAKQDTVNGVRGIIGLPPVASPKKGKKQ